MGNRPIRQQRTRRRQVVLAASIVLAAAIILPVVWLWLVFARSAPQLEGRVGVQGLAAAVEVARDVHGVPTLTASSRPDLARALGFLHGQERFFQMDLLRRLGAGELTGLVGSGALPIDQKHRLHRFRARAETILHRMPASQRDLIDAYTAGVNAGLSKLGHFPFEYTFLRVTPEAWRPADTLLVIYAMYFDLQDGTGWGQRRMDLARQVLGPELANFLYPAGTPSDAALDGTMLSEPPVPQIPAPTLATPLPSPETTPAAHGSNAFAVSGHLTGTGAAIVANDMHLGLNVPNIWYRIRMKIVAAGATTLDLDGVTLPGTPMLVTGTNGKIAWGFTDSYIRTGDLVVLDTAPNDPASYMTPNGPQPLEKLVEPICPVRAPCVDLHIEESEWGPVVARDTEGRRLAFRWSAHDANAVDLDGMLALETAVSVREGLAAAHRAGMPQQNFVIGDHEGHVAWSIIGQVPKRIGLDDDQPHSWADGARGWQGYLKPSEIPEIVDPPDGLIWTANNRIVGGTALATLGAEGYAEADRARQIRDDLRARDHFTEHDLLSIELDARGTALDGWQQALVRLLEAYPNDRRSYSMLQAVRDWGGAAVTGSVGYRLVRTFQERMIHVVYGGFGGPIKKVAGDTAEFVTGEQSSWPSLRLLNERPARLVPPPYHSWQEVDQTLLGDLNDAIDHDAGGTLERFTWGARNHIGIHHPLSRFVPLLGHLTDPPDEPVDGDSLQPRVVTPGFGASERLVVSPGHEADGIFEMPVGNAANPTTPYFMTGTGDWMAGNATPFLPGLPRWILTLEPG